MADTRDASPDRVGYSHDDPSLKTGPGGLTVWDLKKMVEDKRLSELENLFNNGLKMYALPVGYAAGTACALLAGDNKLMSEWLDIFAEKNWRGKIFFPSNNRSASEGRNRVRSSFVTSGAPIIPMIRFTAVQVDGHFLAPRATSNLVVLSYAHPLTRRYPQELVARRMSSCDIMVAVKGKYGPVFMSKTWLGQYGEKGTFIPSDPDKPASWCFLDFNEGALQEQRASHWD